MKYSLCIILPEQEDIKEFREAYGQVTPPHITILYRTEINAIDHINEVLKEFKPFTVTLHGNGRSEQEHFLYLLLTNPQPLLDLHKAIHTGPLENERNVRMPKYIPHLTLGEFESAKELEDAKQNFSQTVTINELAYLTHDEDGSVIKNQSLFL